MNFLKKLPIKYKGELHDIKLVNFLVDMDEVKHLVPPLIKIRDFGGKAMISMVDVKLKKMHPTFIPSFLHFGYRHIAFRLLVDDAYLNNGECKGIFFLKAFTNKAHIVFGGKMLTEYRLENAIIKDGLDSVVIKQGINKIAYQRDDKTPENPIEFSNLKDIIGALDRAYSVVDGKLRVTQIQREKWPIEPVACAFFKNSFFKSSELQGVFRVKEVIYYSWLPAAVVKESSSNKVKIQVITT
ncbi:MAG TPA: DUF2071 domain-containing protein [Cytophagales bacterium]|nr:DUF2071 domain-containing protein [Cytophagales bacterium]